MAPPDLPDDPEAAFALGAREGGNPQRIAGDCPYDHRSLALRTRWMDGFSSTRRALDAAAPDKDDAQPRR